MLSRKMRKQTEKELQTQKRIKTAIAVAELIKLVIESLKLLF